MDFKEMLRKISFPLKAKENDRNLIKDEEIYIEEIQMMVRKLFYVIFNISFVIKIIILFQQDLKLKKRMQKKQIMEICLLKNMEIKFLNVNCEKIFVFIISIFPNFAIYISLFY